MTENARDILKAAGLNVHENPSKESAVLIVGSKGKQALDKTASKPKKS
jgi:hypothetical protein